MSLTQPYKGLAETLEPDVHIGTDANRPADNPKFQAADYTKLQRAANPMYYRAKASNTNFRYSQPATNNGQELEHPTYTEGNTVALFSNGEVHQAVAQQYAWGDAAASPTADSINHNEAGHSNYAMSLAARKIYGSDANVHHAVPVSP